MNKYRHNAITAIAGSLYATTLQAQMQVLARTANNVGGEIVIKNVKCGSGNVIISSNRGGGNSLHGCLTTMGSERFYVSWDDGGTSVLSAYGWTWQ